ncbi:MAG TPA: SDR family NAD(P)-dependent oxidoreductase [Candidatus Goldiibacteriota bacterium]|nr:SDR family NAD(P)-dependent oxidoreductase [Candidatus Goldiibacteriota bacterium]
MAQEKIILITGATRGLGFAMSEKLASAGHRIIMACRERVSGEMAVAKLKKKGLNVELSVCDVEKPAEIEAMASGLASRLPRLDVLINNAGINIEPMDTTIETINLKIFERIMNVNLRGTLYAISRLLPLLKKSPEARIINFSSGLSQLSVPRMGPHISYSISKTAVNQLTWTFADHLKNTNVSIYCVDPGWVKTDMGGPNAMLEIQEGIDTPVWLATTDIKDLKSGYFYKERKILPW